VNLTVSSLFNFYLSYFAIPPEGVKCKHLILICRPSCAVFVSRLNVKLLVLNSSPLVTSC